MAETSWSEDSAPPPKKKVPTWVWFCGGGCLALLILGALAAGLAFKYVKQSLDPEQQWANVAEVLPFDERPPELELKLGWSLGMGWYTFKDSRGFIAMLMQPPASDKGHMRKQMLDEQFSGSVAGFGGRKDMQKGKLNVQGRELDVLRFYALGARDDDEDDDHGAPDSGPPGRPKANPGAAVWVDLTSEGDQRTLMLMLMRTDQHATDAISDAEIQTFLKPFKVGGER